MSLQDDDSPFEAALKGDLPSGAEQARVRQRLLGAGISVGSGLAASSAVASTQVGWGASIAAKLNALSLAVKVGVVVAVAAPLVAVPLLRSSVEHRAATGLASVRPPSTPSALAASPLGAPFVPALPIAAPEVEPPSRPAPESVKPSASDAPLAAPQNGERSLGPSARVEPSSPSSALPAVAAFDSLGSGASQAENERLRATTLAAETRLLDRAFAEIAAGHRPSAAALIAEHQKRFPNGLLSQERERARARLLQNSQGE